MKVARFKRVDDVFIERCLALTKVNAQCSSKATGRECLCHTHESCVKRRPFGGWRAYHIDENLKSMLSGDSIVLRSLARIVNGCGIGSASRQIGVSRKEITTWVLTMSVPSVRIAERLVTLSPG